MLENPMNPPGAVRKQKLPFIPIAAQIVLEGTQETLVFMPSAWTASVRKTIAFAQAYNDNRVVLVPLLDAATCDLTLAPLALAEHAVLVDLLAVNDCDQGATIRVCAQTKLRFCQLVKSQLPELLVAEFYLLSPPPAPTGVTQLVYLEHLVALRHLSPSFSSAKSQLALYRLNRCAQVLIGNFTLKYGFFVTDDFSKKLNFLMSYLEILAPERRLGWPAGPPPDHNHAKVALLQCEQMPPGLIGVNPDWNPALSWRPALVQNLIQTQTAKLLSLSSSPLEALVIRKHLWWLYVLPWKKIAVATKEPTLLRQVLDARLYGLASVKKQLIALVTAQNSNHSDSSEQLLSPALVSPSLRCAVSHELFEPTAIVPEPSGLITLVGPLGLGQTTIVKSLAAALGRPLVQIALTALRTPADITGQARYHAAAQPGCIITALRTAAVSNPVVLLDGIDKLTTAPHDVKRALLMALDPAARRHFWDHFLGVEYDLSGVLFVATAGDFTAIDSELRPHLAPIYLTAYSPLEKVFIAKNHLMPLLVREYGLNPEHFCIDTETVRFIIRHYSKQEPGVAQLHKVLRRLAQRIATRQAEPDPPDVVVITRANLAKWLRD